MNSDFIFGLDLGKSQDPTALCILEKTRPPTPRDARRAPAHYASRFLKRWPLGTKYTDIVDEVVNLTGRLTPQRLPLLAVDETGVGAAVVDLLSTRIRAVLCPILITSGHQVSFDGRRYHVPKKELVSVTQVLLQSQRLKIGPAPERETLVKELLSFSVKITTAGNETFEAWRERDHDDLVLAVAMAAWLGEACPAPYTGSVVLNPTTNTADQTGEAQPGEQGKIPDVVRRDRDTRRALISENHDGSIQTFRLGDFEITFDDADDPGMRPWYSPR
jgi:hypothetical protein